MHGVVCRSVLLLYCGRGDRGDDRLELSVPWGCGSAFLFVAPFTEGISDARICRDSFVVSAIYTYYQDIERTVGGSSKE